MFAYFVELNEINMNQLYHIQVPEDSRKTRWCWYLFSARNVPQKSSLQLAPQVYHPPIPSLLSVSMTSNLSTQLYLGRRRITRKVSGKLVLSINIYGTFVEFPGFFMIFPVLHDLSAWRKGYWWFGCIIALLHNCSRIQFLAKGCTMFWEVLGLGVSEMTIHFPPLNRGTACHTHCDDLKGKKLLEVPWLVLGRRHFFLRSSGFSASIWFAFKLHFWEGLGFLILRHIQIVSFRKRRLMHGS